jgi:hypothetical protein
VNKLTEMRLVIASTRSVKPGKDSGEITFVERDWYWWTDTPATEAGKVFRLEISVALREERREQPLYTLTASLFGELAIDQEGLPAEQDGGDSGDTGDNDGSSDVDGSSGARPDPGVTDGEK